MVKFFKTRPHLFILGLILLIGLFFRTYQIIERFEFAHDGDLYSWIVKDIVIDKHPRLIGQLTSADGIFIGSLFYYALIPSFFLFNMDPIGTLIPITILGIVTIFSYWWVFSKLFNPSVGLIAAFLQAVLLKNVQFDRWVVPSTPTNLWVIWYFYTLLQLARGNFSVLPILALLIGLIWHVHIALLPTLLAVPVAVLLSKKLPNLKQLGFPILVWLVTFSPLVLFEIKHDFSQTTSLIQNFTVDHGGGTGLDKLNLMLIKISASIVRLLFYPQTLPFINYTFFIAALLLSAWLLIKKKLLGFKEMISLYTWLLTVILFFTFSSTIVSEYYFANIEIIFLTIVSLWLYFFLNLSSLSKKIILSLLAVLLIKNLFYFTSEDVYKKGYLERKAVADFITADAKQKGFPCVAVSYITQPGENVGFRYFFWLNKLHVNQPKSGSPVYSIVLPKEMAEGAVQFNFGQIKVITPENVPSPDAIKYSCSGQNSNLTDPLFGFTQ